MKTTFKSDAHREKAHYAARPTEAKPEPLPARQRARLAAAAGDGSDPHRGAKKRSAPATSRREAAEVAALVATFDERLRAATERARVIRRESREVLRFVREVTASVR